MSNDATLKRHVVVSVRGIRTFGLWQRELGELLHRHEDSIEYICYETPWFDALSFAIPFARARMVRRFREWLSDHISEDQRVDIVAHSFGTFVVTKALQDLPEESPVRVTNLILCGSVLPHDFRWGELLKKRVSRVINECGMHDLPLVASQFFVFGTGMAGKVGFTGGHTSDFQNRYFPFGHGGFFEKDVEHPEKSFMEVRWVDSILTKTDDPIPPYDARPENPSWPERIWYTILNFASPAKVAGYLSLPLLILASFLILHLERSVAEQSAESEKLKAKVTLERLERSRLAVQYSQLAEAARLALGRRQSAAVLDALFASLAEKESDPAIQHALEIQKFLRLVDPHRQGSAQLKMALDRLNENLDRIAPELDNDPFYWHVKGLTHSQFLQQKGGREVQLALIRESFEKARANYKALKRADGDYDLPAILVALDYGTALMAADESKDAGKILTRALADAEANPSIAAWVESELHAALASIHRHSDRPKALKHIKDAIELAGGDERFKPLHAHYLVRLAWIQMDEWEERYALPNFQSAAKELKEVAKNDSSYLNEWLHAQHGRILAQFHADGDLESARKDLEAHIGMMKEIHAAAGNPNIRLLTESQMEALLGRIFNSMERLADIQLDSDDAASTIGAAEYYLAAGEFAAQQAAQASALAVPNEASSRWNSNRARMLYRAAAAFAATGELADAREARQNADEITCEIESPSELKSLELNDQLSEYLIEILAANDASERMSAADLTVGWIVQLADGFADRRPRRDDLEFLYFCAVHAEPHASPDQRRALALSFENVLSESDIDVVEALKPAAQEQAQTRQQPLHEKFRFHLEMKPGN